jgi:hypothetical protein
MHIKFLKYGAGNGKKAAKYLLQKQDHNGIERSEVRVLRGDPHAVAAVADSLSFVHRYRSAVIAWAPEDAPSKEQIQAVLDDFENLAWPDMEPERYAWSAVLHREENGGVHVHTLSARVDLATGKSHNIAPPGWQKDYDALRDFWNHSKGWARPDDPLRARVLQPGHKAFIDAARLRQGLAVEPDTRQLITDYLVGRIENGSVRDRDGILAALHEAGLETPRRGKDYITVLDRETGVRCRLKGAIYEQSWTVRRAIEIADQRRAEPDRRIDARAARQAGKKFEEAVTRRAAYNAKKYPAPETTRPDELAAIPEHRLGALHGHLTRELGADAILGAPDHVTTARDPGHRAQPAHPSAAGRRDSLRTLRWENLRTDRRDGPNLHGWVSGSALKAQRPQGQGDAGTKPQEGAWVNGLANFPSTIIDQFSTGLEEQDSLLQAVQGVSHDRTGGEIARSGAQVERWIDVTLERAKRAHRILEQIIQQAEQTIRRTGAQGRIALAIAGIMNLIEDTKLSVQGQLQAMACDLYDLARLDQYEQLRINTWSNENILNAVGRLLVENARGSDIWIRPEPQAHSSLILMETTRNTFDRLLQDGLVPSVIVQVRPGLFQGWIRTGHGKTSPRRHAMITRYLRTRYPDQAPFKANPFGRLAGLKNMKVRSQSQEAPLSRCLLLASNAQIAARADWLKRMAMEQHLKKNEQAWNRPENTAVFSTALTPLDHWTMNRGHEEQGITMSGLRPQSTQTVHADIWDIQPYAEHEVGGQADVVEDLSGKNTQVSGDSNMAKYSHPRQFPQ